MAFEFSLQTALVGSLFSSVTLSATLCYLWRLDPSQRTLLYWSLAFAVQSLRMCGQFGLAAGYTGLWPVTDTLFGLFALFVWLGTRHLESRPHYAIPVGGLLAATIAWEAVALHFELPFLARTLPLYGTASIILLLAAAALFRLARRHPGIGYRGLGMVIGLLGLHYLDYPFLRPIVWLAPIGFGLAAALMLLIGVAMLIITQRRQQFELQNAMARLGEELAGRRESEYRYQTLVDELDEGIVVVARDGRVLSANPAAARMLDTPLDSLLDQPLTKLPYTLFRENGSTLDESEYPLRKTFATGQPYPPTIERLQRGEGDSVWLSINTRPLFREGSDKPYAVVAAFSDVSDRKASERSLLASELRFRSIFEGVDSIAVQGYDRERKVIYWNDASERFYGYRKDEALGRPIEELVIQQEDVEAFRSAFADFLASAQAPLPGEYLARRKDGSSIAIYSTQVLISNLQGDPEVYCIDIDVSAMHRLQGELEEASERFRALSESSELGMVVTDEHANFVWCNPRYLTLIDSTMAEVLDGTWIEHLHPDDRAPMRASWQQAVATQTGFASERRVVNRDGSIQWGQAHIVPIRGQQGCFRGFVATVEDITTRKEAEAALRQSEAKFRATFDQAFQFIGLLDPKGILLDANRTALTFSGIAAEEVIGKPFPDTPWWHNPGARATLIDAIARAGKGEFVRFETLNTDAEGKEHHIDFSLKPVFGSNGEVEMLIPEGRDITLLKEAEEALRLSEARFAGAFHSSLDYITISRIDTGELIDANEAFEKITGWPREEAIGKSSTELGIWHEPGARDKAIEQLRRDGYLREYPLVVGTRSGNTVDGLLNASIITTGSHQLLLGVVRDIRKQKAAEEVLRQSEEKFSRIVHYSPAALVITDPATGTVTDFNLAWQQMLGYTREQAIGKTSLEFGLWADPEDRTRLYRALEEGGGELDRFECRYRRADGEILYGLASGRQFDIGGRPSFLWSVTDITLRHAMEERMAALNSELEARVEARTEELRLAQDELIRAEKLAALGALVAGIAHELNTPIGNSVTVASTLHDRTAEFSDHVADGTLKRSSLNSYLETARTASDLLLRSLNQARNLVASFKQVAVDQTSDQRRTFDLGEVVGEVLTTLSPSIRKTPFSVTVEIPPGIVMDSYPGPLGQVVSNFVNNALLHAFDGRLAGTIALRATPGEENDICMTVSDNGNGIPEEHLRRIFDPFFTTKLGQGGSGLGLNIVYNIVSQILGGRVSVESRVGAGTTFVLKMPLCAPGTTGASQNAACDSDDPRPA